MATSLNQIAPVTHRGLRRPLMAAIAALTLLVAGLSAIATPAGAAEPGSYVLYDDSIANGFGNWSWAEVDTGHSDTVHSGSAAVSVDAGPWAAFYIGRSDDQPIPRYGSLRFELHGGSSTGPIGVQIISSAGESQPLTVTPSAGSWTSYSIDLADLGGFTSFSGVWFQNFDGADRPTFYIDDVRVVTEDAPPPSSGPELLVDLGTRSITRTVIDPASGRSSDHAISFPHPISDDIYGMNFVTNAVREELAVPVNRWGGNSTERYNHEIATTNIGNDWFFMNNPSELGDDHRFENDNQADGTDTIMTLPMSGWVAKNRDANCGYPTVDVLGPENNAGPQDAQEPHWLNQALLCGNGFVGGERIYGVDPTVTSRRADEAFAADWVSHLVDTHGTAAQGGVEIYALGNEPGLWHSTHADVRPDPLGRTELIDLNQTWAAAVKQSDPTAAVIGPVLWSGYSYYVTSEELLINNQRPGDVPTFIEDYLTEMKRASDRAGIRLLDQLAVNFYDDRVYGGGTDALRLESTRQLWDPTYAPADWWVTRDFLYGDGSAVVPRMNTLIDEFYPGTELAITEYNFGGPGTLVGGLAQADALGIFGREGLDTATVWEPYAEWTGLTEEEYGARPIIDAFRLFRNYDGQGSRFGDISNYGQSSDEGAVAVHAATRSSDGAVTVLIINKSTTDYNSRLTVSGQGGSDRERSAERYDYSAATDGVIARGDDVTLGGDGSVISLPARSATLLIIPDGEPIDPIAVPTLLSGIELIDPPAGTAEGGPLDNADTMYLWLEQGPTELSSRLKVNRVRDGNFRGSSNTRAWIPAGTTVCSWYVHVDNLRDRGRMFAELRFDGTEVLGVIGRRADLRRSDGLAAPGTDYVYNGSEASDRLTLRRSIGPDGAPSATMVFNMAGAPTTDSIRILTDCSSG